MVCFIASLIVRITAIISLCRCSVSVGALRNGADPLTFFGGIDHVPYVKWLGSDRSTAFDHAVFIKSVSGHDSVGMALHWKADSDKIHLAIVARARGWMGFGLSGNGGMRGADMVLFEARNSDTLTDAFVLDELYPQVDDCQNWELNYSQATDGFLIVEASRLLDTGDTQDHRIYDDAQVGVALPHRVIVAWGDSETWSYHGPTNVAKREIQFHGNGGDLEAIFEETMDREAEGSFFIGANDFTIPGNETTYKSFCFDADVFEAQGAPMNESLHVIGIQAVVDPRASQYVHHYTLRSSEGQTCENKRPFESVYGWSPGVSSLLYPPFLGSPLGKDGFAYYNLQIHYNNPNMDLNVLDSSGVRVYWTSKKREYDVGMFGFADPLVALKGSSVGDGFSKHEFHCPASCSAMTLSVDDPITVIGSSFHMHMKGKKASLSVIRNGEIFRSTSVEFFDYSQNGVQPGRQEGTFQLLPGDSFHSSCYYDTNTKAGVQGTTAVFGLASQDEMCMSYFTYYPRRQMFGVTSLACPHRLPIPACAADHTLSNLEGASELNRTFGIPSSRDGRSVCLSPTAAPTLASTLMNGENWNGSDGVDKNDSSGGRDEGLVALAIALLLGCLPAFP